MVELVRSGRSPKELSRQFEPPAQAIRNWVAQADREEGRRADGLTTAERQKLSRLRRENRQLRIEREILSKAAAWADPGTASALARQLWGSPYPGRPAEEGERVNHKRVARHIFIRSYL
jgi:transposase